MTVIDNLFYLNPDTSYFLELRGPFLKAALPRFHTPALPSPNAFCNLGNTNPLNRLAGLLSNPKIPIPVHPFKPCVPPMEYQNQAPFFMEITGLFMLFDPSS